MLLARGSLTFFLSVCGAFGLSSICGIDDLTGFLQNKVDGPPSRMDQDERDLEAAEAEVNTERTGLVKSVSLEAVADKPIETDAEGQSPSDAETEGAVDAELEAMQAEEAEGSEDDADSEGGDESEEEEEEDDSAGEAVDEQEAKQALRERMAERARLAEANHYSFTVGSEVYVGGKKGKVTWDGRPDHDFVKVTWLEGKDNGKTSGVIDVEDVSLQAVKVVEIGTGRHLKKTVATGDHAETKKKKKVKDTSRRRRSVLRKTIYGIKKLPMVLSIPFRGLQHGVDQVRSELTVHTGLAFNGTLVDLLDSAGPKDEEALADEEADLSRRTMRRHKNITEFVRNRTVAAAMQYSKEQINPLISAFTSETRPDSPLANLVLPTNLTATVKKRH